MTEKETGRVIVQIDKKPSDADLAVSVSMYLPDGFLLEATPDSINLGGSMMTNCTFSGCKTGIGIGKMTGGGGIHFVKPQSDDK